MDGARGGRWGSAFVNVGKSLTFKDETEDDAINRFISDPTYVNTHVYQILNSTLNE